MIALLTPASRPLFLAACSLDPILGAHIRTDLLVFGPDSLRADFWLATDEKDSPTAAIGRTGDQMTVSTCDALDPAEFTAFARAAVGFSRLLAVPELCEATGLPGARYTAPAMIYSGNPFRLDYSRISPQLPLSQVYDLITADFAGEASTGERQRWHADTSHLFRHGLGFGGGIFEDGCLVSTGGVYAMGDALGVIACLATRRDYRGRGYGSLLTAYLCDRLLEEGLTPALLCAEESLAPFYSGLGFQIQGHWGRIVL